MLTVFSILFLFVCFIHSILSKTCEPHNLDGEFIDRCDLLRDQMNFHLDKWFDENFDKNLISCLTNMQMKLGNYEVNFRSTNGFKRPVTFTNPLPFEERCKSVQTTVWYNRKSYPYKIIFSINPTT